MKRSLKRLGVFLVAAMLCLTGIQYTNEVWASRQRIEYIDGDIYEGNVNDNTGEKQGKGKYICTDGTIITGTWKNDYLTGQGTVIYPNRDKYAGSFKNDKRNGGGTYRFRNGDTYRGKWKNDKMNGKGKYTWRNKRYVTGTWKNGKLNGIATYKNGKYKYTVGVYKGKVVKVYGRKRA